MAARRAVAEAEAAPATPLTPVHYALLALLGRRAAHGYELQRAFSSGGDLYAIVPLEQPTLYAALKELATRGLISGHEEREGLRPPKTVYSLTNDGERLLFEWLEAPVERMRQVRLDFLLKLYFNLGISGARVRALVDAQIATCHQYLSDLEAHAAALDPDGFAYVVTQSRSSAARSTLDWLREYRRRL
jgi:PadR family transcriptional regulator AphA